MKASFIYGEITQGVRAGLSLIFIHYRTGKTGTAELHSGQTTGHARDLSTSGHFPVTFTFPWVIYGHEQMLLLANETHTRTHTHTHTVSTVNLRHSSHLGTKSSSPEFYCSDNRFSHPEILP